MNLVAEVILPLAVKSNFTYRVPPGREEEALPGMRVLVVFGKSKLYTGIIRRVKEENDTERLERLRFIDEFLDPLPVVSERQFELFAWLAFYYFCTEGEVLKAALPSGMKLESSLWIESLVQDVDQADVGYPEFQLLDALRVKPGMTAAEVAALWQIENPATRLRTMQSRGLIRLSQRIERSYKPLTEAHLGLSEACRSEEAMKHALDSTAKAPKQQEVLMLVIQAQLRGQTLGRKTLSKQIKNPGAAVAALIEKGFVNETEVPVDRLASLHWNRNEKEIEYTAEQAAALSDIRAHFATEAPAPVLLHGVTGSGKTHLYLDLIADCLSENRQALYLLPEIALTPQIIDKVKTTFGDKVGVYHSRFSEAERVEVWQKVLSGEYQVIVGVRSAVFLPLADPGLIIVDEEHDHSFKQDNPNPRYQARDLAVWMAATWGSRVVLGSATPSLESWHNAQSGRYKLVSLTQRATESKMPQITLVDNREQRIKKSVTGHFSKPLLDAISETLNKKEQVILFQNRRGYVPVLVCTNCGHVPRCINCDITLTWHKASGHLRCHYCGYTDSQVSKCEVCGHYDLKQQGIGTEKIEEDLIALFPAARVGRMDFDTTRSRHGFSKLIEQFQKGALDILVGTQMVSKGLDFENVTLVGVVDADLLLNFSDFRAFERAYQLLTQVAGRAGRSHKPGRVLIQTWMPDNTVLQALQKDIRLFYDPELKMREQLHYPPFTRLIRIEVKDKKREFLENEAQVLRELLLPHFGAGLLGPEYPVVGRVRGEYRMHFLLKIGRTAPPQKVRDILRESVDRYYQEAQKKTMRISIDVDPM